MSHDKPYRVHQVFDLPEVSYVVTEHPIRARYGVNCYCPDGEFKSYGSTLKAGHIYAMLMSPQECVNCQTISMVFSNFIHGLVPSTSGSLFGKGESDLSTALGKEFDRLNKREERKKSRMSAEKIAEGDNEYL